MNRVLIALALFPLSALADGVALPSVDAGMYTNALNQAIKAASIQSGAQANMDHVVDVATKKATETGSKVISDTTPLNPKDVFAVVGTYYALGIKHQIKKSFKNPLFPHVTNTVEYSTAGDRKSSLTWGFSF